MAAPADDPGSWRRQPAGLAVVAAAASVLAGLIAVGAAAAARRHRDRAGTTPRTSAATDPAEGTDRTDGADQPDRAQLAEAEERERAVLDVLSSNDPARLVVFTLRRARGYAEQARRRRPAALPPGSRPARRRRAAELTRLDEALDRFRVSGVPVDDLIAVRRLERWAAGLATSTDPSARDASPS